MEAPAVATQTSVWDVHGAPTHLCDCINAAIAHGAPYDNYAHHPGGTPMPGRVTVSLPAAGRAVLRMWTHGSGDAAFEFTFRNDGCVGTMARNFTYATSELLYFAFRAIWHAYGTSVDYGIMWNALQRERRVDVHCARTISEAHPLSSFWGSGKLVERWTEPTPEEDSRMFMAARRVALEETGERGYVPTRASRGTDVEWLK